MAQGWLWGKVEESKLDSKPYQSQCPYLTLRFPVLRHSVTRRSGSENVTAL